MIALSQIVLSPWIQKATCLIGKSRKIGGNMFRHQINTLGVLMDYKIIDSILLKAGVTHDVIEDFEGGLELLREVDDPEKDEVIELVLEVTYDKNKEAKEEFLKRILVSGSDKAKILKAADRIDNMTQLTVECFTDESIRNYAKQTEDLILPGIKALNPDMHQELCDLIKSRRGFCGNRRN